MKQNIVKDLTTDELREKLGEERASLTKMRMSHAVSPIENPMKMRNARKVIARLITEIKKRETVNNQTN